MHTLHLLYWGGGGGGGGGVDICPTLLLSETLQILGLLGL